MLCTKPLHQPRLLGQRTADSLGVDVGKATTAAARINMDAELHLLGEIDGDRQKIKDGDSTLMNGECA